MAVTSAQYTVTTSPTKIVSADIAAEMVYVHSETAISYLGDSTVSSTTGYKLDINDKISLANHEGEIWAVSAISSTISVLIITR
jgi:outer membrane lipoprotein-sorting protein